MVDINAIEKSIVAKLKERYGASAVTAEYGAPMRFAINVVSDTFKDKPEDIRQDEVWELIKTNFPYSDFKYVGLVMTWTPEEKEAYDREQVA